MNLSAVNEGYSKGIRLMLFMIFSIASGFYVACRFSHVVDR